MSNELEIPLMELSDTKYELYEDEGAVAVEEPPEFERNGVPSEQKSVGVVQSVGMALCALFALIGSCLLWDSIGKGQLRGSQAESANFEVFGVLLAFCLNASAVYTDLSRLLPLAAMGMIFQLASDGIFVSWPSTSAARTADTSNMTSQQQESVRLHIVGSVLCWIGTLAAAIIAHKPKNFSRDRCGLLVPPAVLGLVGIAVAASNEEPEHQKLATKFYAITVIVFVFVVLALTSDDKFDVSMAVLVLIGSGGWGMLPDLFEAKSNHRMGHGMEAGLILCWLSVISTVLVVEHGAKVTTSLYAIGKKIRSVKIVRARTKLVFAVFGTLGFVACVLNWIAIDIGVLVGDSANAAHFEVCTMALVFVQCTVWALLFRWRWRGLILIPMGMVFELATTGVYLSWSNTNLARISIHSHDSTRDHTATVMHVAANIVMWISVMIALTMVWGPNVTNVSTQVGSLIGTAVLAAVGCILLWRFDHTLESPKPFVAASATIVLGLYATLALIGQERWTLATGTMVLVGSKGWFLLQEMFEASHDGDDHDEVQAGFALCWVAIVSIACVLIFHVYVLPTQDPKSAEGTGYDSCVDELKRIGVLDSVFTVEGKEQSVHFSRARIVLGLVFFGHCSVTFEGVSERTRQPLTRCAETLLSQALGDVTVLARHEVQSWTVKQDHNIVDVRITFTHP